MAIEVPLFSAEGAAAGTITLDERLFGRPVKTDLIHRLLILQRANARIATAHTKTRGERRGSTRKLFAQKGTGRARAGASRSPVRKKGGVVFGPRTDRNYTVSMNKKERRAALFSLLSSKVQESGIKVIETFSDKYIKTQAMEALLGKMGVTSGVIAACPTDTHVFLGGRNIPTVKVIGANYLNPADLLKYRELVFSRDSLGYLASVYASALS